MSEADNEAVKHTISLSRRLCAADWLTQQHVAARDTLQSLTSTEEARAKLCTGQLSLWTMCSRETSSSVIRRPGSAHIVVDGFQLLALSKIFSALVLWEGPEAATSTFLGLLAEAFLCADRVGMASLCKNMSVNIAKGNPNAFLIRRSQASALESHHAQRMFLLGHELGHVMVGASATERSAMRESLDVRLKELRGLLRESAPPDIRAQIDDGPWNPANGDYWDELCCDTLSVELLNHMTGMMGGRNRVLICEALVAAAFGLDILRLFKRIALKDGLPSESDLLATLFNESYIRFVHLSRLVSFRFGVSEREMADSMGRFHRAFSSDNGGLFHLFSILPDMKKLMDANVRDWKAPEVALRVESMIGWRASRDALITERIF
jgi:hypothetical protein